MHVDFSELPVRGVGVSTLVCWVLSSCVAGKRLQDQAFVRKVVSFSLASWAEWSIVQMMKRQKVQHTFQVFFVVSGLWHESQGVLVAGMTHRLVSIFKPDSLDCEPSA